MVGPYTLYGEPVIEACIAGGAHYVDLTGEMPFVRRMIDAADERAAAAGVKIVNTSGFEALPPDLIVLLAAETARERWSEELATADLDADLPIPKGGVKLSDIISGGTLQSLAEIPRRGRRGDGRRLRRPDHRAGAGPARPQRQPDLDRPPLQRPGRRGRRR